jgi:hypothetical protein
MQFTTENALPINLYVCYFGKIISKRQDTKFPGLLVDSTLSQKLHTEEVLQILSATFYVLCSVKPCMSQEVMNIGLLCCLLSSVISNGWGNSNS